MAPPPGSVGALQVEVATLVGQLVAVGGDDRDAVVQLVELELEHDCRAGGHEGLGLGDPLEVLVLELDADVVVGVGVGELHLGGAVDARLVDASHVDDDRKVVVGDVGLDRADGRGGRGVGVVREDDGEHADSQEHSDAGDGGPGPLGKTNSEHDVLQ